MVLAYISCDQRAEGLEPEFHVEGDTLFVKGVILQTITEVGRDSDPATQDAPHLSPLLAVLADITFFQRSNYRYPTGEHISMIMSTILEADQPENDGDVISFWGDIHSRDLLFEPELSHLDKTKHAAVIQLMEWFQRQNLQRFRNICRAVAGRRLCFTHDGYVGLVPTKTEEHDKICILKGFAMPFVLREAGKEGGSQSLSPLGFSPSSHIPQY
jgi:hypothetical protein